MKSVLLEKNQNISLSPTENTQYIYLVQGGSAEVTNLELNFEKEGVACEIIVLGKMHEGQSVELTTTSRHLVPNTSCVTNYYVALENLSSSNYVGKIIIAKKAFQTNSYLNNKTLVIGEGTKNITRPILEIEADDVKASHGSTTGRVREDDVYYLTSRGLTKKEAEEVIVEGFFESVVAKIEAGVVREKVRVGVKS
ncbi:MAG: FeS assembly protein sufD [candidate division WWE3 bacterium GW2011_GWF2_41_45]|uniref:SUF system FeS cluster assembly SufBD core domain-containing protein n=3 Tax=Katanobacteria TaxID=422282 RepID=A0A1F4VZ67_UNCKA|nr:MAG: FeS assembly protein sufD [candidate division WWE3 bacterium GW2011_GWC2_41_23]KKS10412.1 MAG: FeS assembly protein sufD [candidate division WWE3 bacterium GW2011_GWF2_41_45]KKS12040.1 MAG: FeS assembly protein sufD [candidate division WWE3 bacterium GW2011_GWF1_41_53]KKS20062.1 MAG: FeS assembly protein sufD [candidate division WWE3 bacterium GW2011_GWE1_41_72]KKS26598.1 MAG: FeS assembly protein sufD [candidate division WWE3 bacterium GW2011_GWC1_42_102]KKS50674.1 MAG: FeS assembly p